MVFCYIFIPPEVLRDLHNDMRHVKLGLGGGYNLQLWTHWAVPVLFIAWALADMARYPFYAASLLGRPPQLLTWLRCCRVILKATSQVGLVPEGCQVGVHKLLVKHASAAVSALQVYGVHPPLSCRAVSGGMALNV